MNLCSDRIKEYFKFRKYYSRPQTCLLQQINDGKCSIDEDTYLILYLSMSVLLILNMSPALIPQAQYGCDYYSWLEMGKDNTLTYYLNDSHREQSIKLILKSNQVPIILQKPNDDYSGVDLIHLGYISSPIDKSDQDALIQKMNSELKDQEKDFNTTILYEQTTISFYEDDQ
ncbi:unnamed protein product [Paramecium octaurelia]|uniref:Uncharacterized protein n=1 Tax=Paramecium octaurelia TaxID=43137 RepID=A0A8S1U2L9_PAROT|nr:unnamed protein product [Paramecium octaurelia]